MHHIVGSQTTDGPEMIICYTFSTRQLFSVPLGGKIGFFSCYMLHFSEQLYSFFVGFFLQQACFGLPDLDFSF